VHLGAVSVLSYWFNKAFLCKTFVSSFTDMWQVLCMHWTDFWYLEICSGVKMLLNFYPCGLTFHSGSAHHLCSSSFVSLAMTAGSASMGLFIWLSDCNLSKVFGRHYCKLRVGRLWMWWNAEGSGLLWCDTAWYSAVGRAVLMFHRIAMSLSSESSGSSQGTGTTWTFYPAT
jgi:hypothetical protein